jgi:hypothetical protein
MINFPQQTQQMQGAKSIVADGSGGIQSGAAAVGTRGTGTSLYHGNVQVDPLCAPQAAQALRILLDHWPRVSKLKKCKKWVCWQVTSDKITTNVLSKRNPYNFALANSSKILENPSLKNDVVTLISCWKLTHCQFFKGERYLCYFAKKNIPKRVKFFLVFKKTSFGFAIDSLYSNSLPFAERPSAALKYYLKII